MEQLPKARLTSASWTPTLGLLYLCPEIWVFLVFPATPWSLWALVYTLQLVVEKLMPNWSNVEEIVADPWVMFFIVSAFCDHFLNLYQTPSLLGDFPRRSHKGSSWLNVNYSRVLSNTGFTWQPQGLRGALSHVPIINIRFTTLYLSRLVGTLCFRYVT